MWSFEQNAGSSPFDFAQGQNDKLLRTSCLPLLSLLEEEGYGCGVLEDTAGGGGGCAGDGDGVTFGGKCEGIGCVDAVSAAGGEEWG